MILLSSFLAVLFVTFYQHASAAASTIFFQASPTTIYPVLTKSLKLRCSVENEVGASLARRQVANTTHTSGTSTETPPTHASSTHHASSTTASSTSHRPVISHADVSHIMSILVSRQDRVTGKLLTVARVSPYDPASASVDVENIKVEGHTDASPISREKGYLEVTWEYPAEAQSGEYFCDIYALDSTLHPVSLTSTARITTTQATTSQLAGFVAQNQRFVTELQQSLAHVTAQLSNLQKESRAQIQGLNKTIDDLQNKTEHTKAQNIQIGAITCANTFVTFPKPYQSKPIVFISIFDFQSTYSTWNLVVTIQNVNTTGFTPVCTRAQMSNNDIRWIAIDNE